MGNVGATSLLNTYTTKVNNSTHGLDLQNCVNCVRTNRAWTYNGFLHEIKYIFQPMFHLTRGEKTCTKI
jgi:hypothetical protein